MGEMADNLNEQGEDLWLDHLCGHTMYPDQCPYCEEEDEFNSKPVTGTPRDES